MLRKLVFAPVFVFVAVLLSACTGPTDPGKVDPPPPGPTFGTVEFVYDRAKAGVTSCLSAGSQWSGRCEPDRKILLVADQQKWPSGPNGEWATDLGGGRFSFTSHGVPASKAGESLGIVFVDPWTCPAHEQFCAVYTNKGISANGVLLTGIVVRDRTDWARFFFTPPSTIIP